MFHSIFKKLGYNVIISDVSNEEIIKLSQEHSSQVGVMTRVEAFVNSLDNYEFKGSVRQEEKAVSGLSIEQIPYIEKDKTVLIPPLGIYSDIIKIFIEKGGRQAEVLEEASEMSIEDGKKFSVSKEYFSLIASMGEVIHKVKGNSQAYTLYYPTTEGGEVFGQYGKLIKDKVIEIGQEIDLETPFLEDFLGDKTLGLSFAKAVIGGDLINLLDYEQRAKYLHELLDAIQMDQLDDAYLVKLATQVKQELKKKDTQKRLLIIGEPLVVYKDYLNNFKLKELEKEYRVVKQPLAESLYLFWDDFAKKMSQTNKAYLPLLKQLKTKIGLVNNILKEDSPYNTDVDELSEVLKGKLDFYAGGFGRYRLAKLLAYKQASGVILVSSMYENTATILKIIREKYKDGLDIPMLDLYFDSNIAKNNIELLETFINYLR